MAFIRGRQIIDATMIANEAMNFWRVKRIKGFVIKLGIMKTFHKINWLFFDFMLMKKGFPLKWRKWISSCISSVQYSAIINGDQEEKFKPPVVSAKVTLYLSLSLYLQWTTSVIIYSKSLKVKTKAGGKIQ